MKHLPIHLYGFQLRMLIRKTIGFGNPICLQRAVYQFLKIVSYSSSHFLHDHLFQKLVGHYVTIFTAMIWNSTWNVRQFDVISKTAFINELLGPKSRFIKVLSIVSIDISRFRNEHVCQQSTIACDRFPLDWEALN